jgi:pre-mRNA-splicing helicase BRR2
LASSRASSSRNWSISKKITDCIAGYETKADPDEKRKEGEIDEEGGVAIVIDEEEQEDEDEEIREGVTR